MKKKILLLLLLVFTFGIFTSPVLAGNVLDCQKALGDVIIDEKLPNIVSTIVKLIKIAVPVLLVIFGMLDLIKGIVAQKEDEIKKGQQILIKRLIAGALIYFIFVVVQMLISAVASDEKQNIMNCANCFINGKCVVQKNT